MEQLDELRDQFNAIDKIYQTVDVTSIDARDIIEDGLLNIDEAEKVLDKIHEQLTVSESSRDLFLNPRKLKNLMELGLRGYNTIFLFALKLRCN